MKHEIGASRVICFMVKALLAVLIYFQSVAVAVAVAVALPALASQVSSKTRFEIAQVKLEKTPKLISDTIDEINMSQRRFSAHLIDFANSLDEFFGGIRIDKESNDTRIRFNLESVFDTSGSIGFNSTIRTKFSLPHTQKKLKLIFENESDDSAETDRLTKGSPTVGQAVEDNRYEAGLRYVLFSTNSWNLHTDGGIKLHSQLDPFFKIRARNSHKFGKWQMRLTESFFWFKLDGLGQKTQLEFDRELSGKFLFRSSSVEAWQKETSLMGLTQGFFLFQKLSRRRAIVYSVGIVGTDRPQHHLESYFASIGYRQRVYKDWLYAELKPIMIWPKSLNWAPTPSILFKIEAIFGNTKI